jgi:hypothetical protein
VLKVYDSTKAQPPKVKCRGRKPTRKCAYNIRVPACCCDGRKFCIMNVIGVSSKGMCWRIAGTDADWEGFVLEKTSGLKNE